MRPALLPALAALAASSLGASAPRVPDAAAAASPPVQTPEPVDAAGLRAALLAPLAPTAPAQWRETRRDPETIEFEASFQSAFPTPYPANATVPLWLFLPSGPAPAGRFPVVVLLHYLGAQNLDVERSLARELNRRGVAALALALPYHLSRAPAGTRSGELAIRPDPASIDRVMVQSVLDVRRAIDVLRQDPRLDASQVGVAGVSLGSLVAELAYGVDARIRRAAFVLGGVDFAQILWRSSLVVVSRQGLRARGYDEAKLAAALRPIEPDGYLKARLAAGADPPGSAFVVAARFDTVVPPPNADRLIADLNEPKVLRLDTGHYGGFFVERRVIAEVATFFGDAASGQAYVPPASVHAPTLRLFAQGATPRGFDIGVGIDVFRTSQAEPAFAMFGLTPHGPEAVFAKSLGGGFAAAATVGIRGPGIGVFWSAVL